MSFLKNFLMKRQLIGSKSFGLAGMRRLATATPSTSAATANAQKAAEKAKQSATAAVGRLSGFIDPLVYYGRVTLEFASQVAKHQKLLSFPDIGKAQDGIGAFVGALRSGAWKDVTVSQAATLVGEGVKIYGFFLVGEIIGRGSIVGYNIAGSGHGDHH